MSWIPTPILVNYKKDNKVVLSRPLATCTLIDDKLRLYIVNVDYTFTEVDEEDAVYISQYVDHGYMHNKIMYNWKQLTTEDLRKMCIPKQEVIHEEKSDNE